jgi:diguanylate cyclase (GGDEF)-like protein/PAS domain S-box-containing protein
MCTVRAKGERLAEDDFWQLVDELPVAWALHSDGVLRAANRAAHTLFGVPQDEVIEGMSLIDFVHPESRESVFERIRCLQTVGEPTPTSTARMQPRHGGELWIESLACLTRWHGRQMVQVMFWDVTERVETETRLARSARHDPLTDAANRLLLDERWRHTMQTSFSSTLPGLVFCDLDGFKRINDELGHQVGDRVLQVVADRLRALVRLEDTVARVGGDEFVVLLSNDVDDFKEVARRIGENLSHPITCDPVIHGVSSASVRVSVGAARALHWDESLNEVLRRADAAMYLDKHGFVDADGYNDPDAAV